MTGSPHCLGLDLGLAHVGAAQLYYAASVDQIHVRTQHLQTDPTGPAAPLADDADRIRRIARWAIARATTSTVLVVVEGPAFAAEHGFPHERAGAWWLTVDQLLRHGLPVAVCPPSTAKKYVAGHGRADKAAVKRAVAAVLPGRGLDRVSDHEADAVALALAGSDWLSWPGPHLEGRRGASLLTAVRWPDRATIPNPTGAP